MMGIDTVQQADVQIDGCIAGYSIKEFSYQLCIQIAHSSGGKGTIIIQPGSSAQIHGTQYQRIIHRENRGTISAYSLFVSQGLSQCLSDYDPRIFHCVVSVHMQIPLGPAG